MKITNMALMILVSATSLYGATFSDAQKMVADQQTALVQKNADIQATLKDIDAKLRPIRKEVSTAQDLLKKNKTQEKQLAQQIALLEEKLTQLKKLASDLAANDQKTKTKIQTYESQITNVCSEGRRILSQKQTDQQVLVTKIQGVIGQMQVLYLSLSESDALKTLDAQVKKATATAQATNMLVEKKLIELAAPNAPAGN